MEGKPGHRNWKGYRLKPTNWRGKSPDKVNSILRKVLAKPHLRDKLSRYSFVTYWHEIVGARIAQHAKPLKVVRGVLYIQVQNPIWAQELGFLKDSIIERLKNFTPSNADHSLRNTITDLRFVVVDQF